MESVDNSTSNQSISMDEGDVTVDQALSSPLQKLTLGRRAKVADSLSGDAVVTKVVDSLSGDAVVTKEGKIRVDLDQKKPDVSDRIIRKRKSSTADSAADVKIIKRVMNQVVLEEAAFQEETESKQKGRSTFRSFLETLHRLVLLEQTSDRILLSGISIDREETFFREGYTTLISPKQRLFTLTSMTVDTPLPERASEVFISNLENSINEGVLVPVLEKFGSLINLRIPNDAKTGQNKGYAFAIFPTPESATNACRNLNQSTLFGKTLVAKITKPKKRLFVGNLPRSRSVEELDHHFKAFLPGFKRAILPQVITIVKVSTSRKVTQSTNLISHDGENRNQGFCFLEFHGSKEASLAKKVISTRKVFGVHLFVDWAEGDEKSPPFEPAFREPTLS